MSIYVMSDIHGCYSAFQAMLGKIDFSKDDRLIIAGDMIDRGPENLEMLKWFSEKPENIEVLMGNHEYEFAFENVPDILKNFEPGYSDNTFKNIKIDPYYDPYCTIRELKKKGASPQQLYDWALALRELPYYKILTVNGKRFIIVHAAYVRRGLSPFDTLLIVADETKKWYHVSVWYLRYELICIYFI